MTLPTINEYNKEVLRSRLIRNYGSLPVLYTDPDWFYDECSYVWNEIKYGFLREWEAFIAEFNIVENYDKYSEIVTEVEQNFGARSASDSYGARSDSSTKGATHTTQAETVSSAGTAFDTTDYGNAENRDSTSGSIDTTAVTDGFTKGAQSDTHTQQAAQDDSETTVTEHTHGNIGVMTATKMWSDEVVARELYSIYANMARKVVDELCLPVW